MSRNWKRKFIDLMAELLWSTTITHPATHHKKFFSVVTFHRVLPEHQRQHYPYPGIVVTPDDLDWFLTFFTRHYSCGTLGEMHTRWLLGESPAKPFLALTFDDGQRDNYDHAGPILAHHSVNASFFIPVEAIEQQAFLWHDRLGFALQAEGTDSKLVRLCADQGVVPSSFTSPVSWVEWLKTIPPGKRLAILDGLERQSRTTAPSWAAPMTWEQIKDLARRGHEIGSHSMSHRMMTECRGPDLDFEVRTSREILESKLQIAVLSFCYPNGNVDSDAEKAVKDAGYIRAVTTHWGTNSQGQNPFGLRRFDMNRDRVCTTNGQRSTHLLAWRMSGLYPMHS